MLVHTTQKTEEQLAYRPLIEDYLRSLFAEFEKDPTAMQAFYEDALREVPARASGGDGFLAEKTADWQEVSPHIVAVLNRLTERTASTEPFKEDGKTQRAHSGVVVDNSKVDYIDRLTYSDTASGEPSVTVIAIGGNTLSRGLTLEGLVCSYFARTARTYDSLMQMGRWFGYRPGYRHLLRVWTTQTLFDWFQELNMVETELRDELVWMQEKGFTPDSYGPRIRVSPNLNITRAAAMRSVSKQISYSDRLLDPAWLDLDTEVLEHNQNVVRELALGMQNHEAVGPSRLYRDVPLDSIAKFLDAFRFHHEEKRIDRPSLASYIENERSHLRFWNVIFKSNSTKSTEPFDYGGSVGDLQSVVRSRKAQSSLAFIQSLVDTGDHRLDFDGKDPADGSRYRGKDEPPVMVIYAIDPLSEPRTGSVHRRPLRAHTHPISVSLTFPKSESSVDYVTPVVAEVEQATAQADMEIHHDQ